MAADETVYSVPTASPVVLARGRDQRTRIGAWRAGALVAPDDATYALADGAEELVSGPAVVAADGSVYRDLVAADLPATLAYGTHYVEIWTLAFPGTEGTREYRRAATLARFELAPPLGEAELVAGAYPDLLRHATGELGGTYQPILDQAWWSVLRRLWATGTPATLVVESGDLFDWYRELALARIFGALYAADPIDRWRDLRDLHLGQVESARAAARLVVDADTDGAADDLGRRSPVLPVHPNRAPSRTWLGSGRGRW